MLIRATYPHSIRPQGGSVDILQWYFVKDVAAKTSTFIFAAPSIHVAGTDMRQKTRAPMQVHAGTSMRG